MLRDADNMDYPAEPLTSGTPNPKGNIVAVNSKNWQELKKPTALEKKAGSDSKRKATFVAA
jgi:hypothetical protein